MNKLQHDDEENSTINRLQNPYLSLAGSEANRLRKKAVVVLFNGWVTV
ncbi:hypothetical protein [Erwinia sp. SLM-02]|nr:hypothetical protein [uncultured Erwinia sp.]